MDVAKPKRLVQVVQTANATPFLMMQIFMVGDVPILVVFKPARNVKERL